MRNGRLLGTSLMPHRCAADAKNFSRKFFMASLYGVSGAGMPEAFGGDALWCAVIAVQRRPEGVAFWVDVQAYDLQRITHQGALTCSVP